MSPRDCIYQMIRYIHQPDKCIGLTSYFVPCITCPQFTLLSTVEILCENLSEKKLFSTLKTVTMLLYIHTVGFEQFTELFSHFCHHTYHLHISWRRLFINYVLGDILSFGWKHVMKRSMIHANSVGSYSVVVKFLKLRKMVLKTTLFAGVYFFLRLCF